MSRKLSDFDLRSVYSAWKGITGPFRCFFRSPNFVSLKHYPDFELILELHERDGIHNKVLETVSNLVVEDDLLFLDLPGEQVIEAVFFLNRDMGINPILTFNNVMHQFGLIGTKKYISSLIGYSSKLVSGTKGWIFALDQQRYAEFSDSDLKQHFNNQYELTEEDLPPLEMLRDLGIKRVVYIYQDTKKEDIDNYMEYLKTGGLPVLEVELEI